MLDDKAHGIALEAWTRRKSKESAKADSPTIVEPFTISIFILVPGPDSGLICIEIVG
jgi:hypothetical protein